MRGDRHGVAKHHRRRGTIPVDVIDLGAVQADVIGWC